MTKRLVIALALAATVLLNAAIAQQPAEFQPAAARIAGSILVDGRSWDYLRNLTDQFGGRLTGTTAYNRAAEWAAEQFRSAGIKAVKLEPFTIPNGWDRGWAHGSIVSPLTRPLHIESLGWAPSTRPGGVRAEVASISEFGPDQIKAQADKFKGKVLMPDLASLFAGGFEGFGKFIGALHLFKEAGAAAVVVGIGSATTCSTLLASPSAARSVHCPWRKSEWKTQS